MKISSAKMSSGKKYLEALVRDGFITSDDETKVNNWFKERPFSLHWELRIILYLGVVLFATGAGMLIYEHIDTIGHTVLIGIIAIAVIACYGYCFKNGKPFSSEKTEQPGHIFDYILLLGSMLFLALEGYLQFQYQLFGNSYEIAALIPALLFFFLAYRFDHLGVLSMAITALASFAGIALSFNFISLELYSGQSLIYTGIAFAATILIAGFLSSKHDFKKHFTFTYYNFGFHTFALAALGGCFSLLPSIVYLVILLSGAALMIRYAIRTQSFYFLLISVIYGYIGITWAIFRFEFASIGMLYYFVVSCVGVIYFFMNYKKILKIK